MKKNISFVSLSSSFVLWLKENISIHKSESASEFLEALDDVLSGKTNTLMIEIDENDNEEFNTYDDNIIAKGLEIQPKTRRVLRDNKEISLTPKEFDILYFLAKNKGNVFTKEQIYKSVWEDDYFLADSNIMAFIRKLRKKIEPNPDEPEYIITIWGIGYKFNDKL